MPLVQTLFPRYSAAATQVTTHAEHGLAFAVQAAKAPDTATRLDAAVRAARALDHAVTSATQLPLRRMVPGYDRYRAGYEAAKLVVNVIIASGVVPGARQRVGRQDILGAQDEFHRAIDTYSTSRSRYERYLALDWMRCAQEDATTGVAMLRNRDVALPLLRGLQETGRLMVARRPVPAEQVRAIDELLRRAAGALDAEIAAADAAHGTGVIARPGTGAEEAARAVAAGAAAVAAPAPNPDPRGMAA